jgi:prolyl-tRNA synthetase
MIIKPYGYAIWELVQEALNERIKKKGIGNSYFPLLIPMSFLEKEKDHIEGFAPELAVVTHGGGEELEEALVVRPTSETIMYNSYAQWIQSWRDLPLMMNQWNNVVRWEKRTTPFLRTSEFLWQEGHTAHATHEEAIELQEWAMDQYVDVYRNYFALDGFQGYKSQSERFAGAATTLTFEQLMPSGKVLQSCTSHDLGQHFSEVFDISFQDQSGTYAKVWQTSWGFSTRSIGGLILGHGDDNGLRLPPKIAPIQVVVVPVKQEAHLLEYSAKLVSILEEKGVRVQLDTRDDESFGFKLNKWEVKGVPIILKIGAQEVEAHSVSYRRRDTLTDGAFEFDETREKIAELLETIQHDMLQESIAYRDANTREVSTYEDFKTTIKEHKGFVKVHWDDNAEIEAKIKEETKATSRCRLDEESDGIDFYTGQPTKSVWLFALSY